MYKELKKIYDENRLDIFAMAVTHLLDIGFRRAQKITDEEIENMEGNGLMTADFCKALVKLTREIALTCGNDCVAIIQFCQKEKVFDTKYFR